MGEKEFDLNSMAVVEEAMEELHIIQVATVATEEEIDLNLSLQFDASKMLRCVSFKETPTPYLFLPPVNPSQTNIPLMEIPPVNPSQTNLSLMEMQMFFPNPNPNPKINIDHNPSMASFSNNNSNNSFSLASSSHNTDPSNAANPPSADANADKTVSTAKAFARHSRRASGGRRSKKVRETIPEPFPWATNKRATVHSKQYLLENNVHTIKGKIHCKKCDKDFELGLDLEDKLGDLLKLIGKKNGYWHNRAPAVWLNPVFPECAFCGKQTTTKPIIEKNKKEINWLFLFLGQMLGCCTLDHLKYFCKHNDIHRTGAKDRLLYLTYTNLVKQLLPDFFVS